MLAISAADSVLGSMMLPRPLGNEGILDGGKDVLRSTYRERVGRIEYTL